MTLATRGRQEVASIPAIQDGNELDRMMFYAEQLADSRMLPGVSTVSAAFTLMALCQADGLNWIEAMRRYHIIEGKPSMRADAMLATFQAKGGEVRWIEATEEACEAHFSHPVHHPEPCKVRMTLERFWESGVAATWKDGKKVLKTNWRNFPDALLKARVSSAGVRMVLPGVVVGIYTPEEVEDFASGRDEEAAPKNLSFPASPAPLAKSLPTPPIPVEPTLYGQDGANDGRTYLQVVNDACADVDAKLHDLGSAAKADPREVHRYLMHQAVQHGYHEGDLPKTVADAIRTLSKLYHAHRRWLREEISEFFTTLLADAAKPEEIVVEAPDEVVDVPLEPTGDASREPEPETHNSGRMGDSHVTLAESPLKTEAEPGFPSRQAGPAIPASAPTSTAKPATKTSLAPAAKANDLMVDAFITGKLVDARAKFRSRYPDLATEPVARTIPTSEMQVYRHLLKFAAGRDWCEYDKQSSPKTVLLALESLDERHSVEIRGEATRYINDKLDAARTAAAAMLSGEREPGQEG